MHFAEQFGGFENVRFRRKDMYNQIEKQKQLMESDVTETLKYLKNYKVDNNGVFRHLIWMDGKSRVDFEVFGDVMAFDATYKKKNTSFHW
ncbi:hypothetical protein Ahy_A07g037028 isoform B [Arachis hypogaea]|uniref:Protein FAR1-RELATED SEQUENCE n=1 Tax=Arachis hypogaea TaxID=3818 RepID=A0A445CHM0_ARAHY|nr:hypothetical protein Ahy_A07g037028 isoform B [Arachis hypogaea]